VIIEPPRFGKHRAIIMHEIMQYKDWELFVKLGTYGLLCELRHILDNNRHDHDVDVYVTEAMLMNALQDDRSYVGSGSWPPLRMCGMNIFPEETLAGYRPLKGLHYKEDYSEVISSVERWWRS
jgi:hypothetical protein